MRLSRSKSALVLLLGLEILGNVACSRGAAAGRDLQVIQLRTQSRRDPLGLGVLQPRLSWQIRSSERSVGQGAYEIRVALSRRALQGDRNLVWASGKVPSSQSTQLPYPGPPLQSRQRYYWEVRVWDTHGRTSDWSAPAYWEMGLLAERDWAADWIEPRLQQDPSKPAPAPMLRKEFQVVGAVARARAYVTSHGLYELYLNGQRVGDQLFTPGWTSYGKRLQYQTYDITSLLKNGGNAIGAWLGDGWYRGTIGTAEHHNHYGDRTALLLQIEVTYQDGRVRKVLSDGSWKSATGPILMSEIYAGEVYDARLERRGWAQAGYDDHGWSAVQVTGASKAILLAQLAPPVRRIEEISPIRIFKTPAGATVADMGQNMTGWVRLRVSGPAGTTVTLRHGEVLDRAGNLYTDNLRAAAQKVEYTLKGGGEEVFEPHFTYQGFRYVAVEGYPGGLTPRSVTGIVVHSDLAPTSEFETSSELVNRLQHNILWSQKDNFLDLPTDCPQRDERLGWTGDAEVFSATAAFNMDVDTFYTKWLGDLAADQDSDGAVPNVVPDVLTAFLSGIGTSGLRAGGTAGWGDAATIIPWNLYLAYGDTRILESQYQSMARWVRFEQLHAGDDYIWNGDFQFGDWLDYESASKGTNFGSTASDLIATAYYAHSVDILQRTARLLGRSDDAQRYATLLGKIRDAFCRTFVSDDGRVGAGTQTAYVLALEFDLLPKALQPLAARHLAEDVRARGHLMTGFLGTPHLLTVLSRFGYLDEAYLLLNRQEFPSWLYPVVHGATTIWERWDGIKPDGSFEDKAMNSFNHYAYGAVGEWMYSTIGGIAIDPAAPGYKHVLIQPHLGGGFTHAMASHVGPYGLIRSNWRLEGERSFSLAVDIPPNSTATVRLPHARLPEITESGGSIWQAAGVTGIRQVAENVFVDIGSGHYEFRYDLAR
ncbi:MAG TPA: family 78 glycoside hydrolase catalytic domain [Steroidobacteraceae bacterium]|nr:family 78 glycoside hydrolase catalytic domain [Steroidobacteraceae bacterium]